MPSISRGPTLSEQVYAHIREQILQGHYQPGQLIVESDLASKLKISRTPVSNAVIMLKERGLIEERNGKLAVLDLTLDDVIDLYECRMAFDGLAASLAATKITPTKLRKLESLLDVWEQSSEGGDSNALWIADLSFHRLIYAVSENRHLIRFSEIATDLLATYRRIILSNLNSGSETFRTIKDVRREHEKIFTALLRREPKSAEEAARHHIANVITYLKRMQAHESTDRTGQLVNFDKVGA